MDNNLAADGNVIVFPNIIPVEATHLATVDPLAPTIFHQPWWLDIVTGGDYNMVEVRDKGEVVGRLPYFLRNRCGLSCSLLPPMTHFLGPAVVEGEGNHTTRFLRRSNIMRELLRQLPKASLYRYKCHGGITDAIAFQQENFITTVQFTYEIAPDMEEALWKNLRVEKRKKIRQAQQLHTIEHLTDAEAFWHFYDTNIRRKGIKNACDKQICINIVETCLARGQGRVYAARNKSNDLVATVFCIWDAATSFYFMSSRTPEAHNGAISLITWEAIKDASARGLIFDFDGLNSSGVVLYITEFGGIIKPRYIITKHTLAGHIALAAKDMMRGEKRYFF